MSKPNTALPGERVCKKCRHHHGFSNNVDGVCKVLMPNNSYCGCKCEFDQSQPLSTPPSEIVKTSEFAEVEIDLVIDTNLYAGNFEREMCGYVTGMWDGETHGGDQAAVFDTEVEGNPFDDLIELRPEDDHGWMQPQHMERTPPKFYNYNSVALHCSRRPTDEQIELMKSRALKFTVEGRIFDRPITGLSILGFRLLTRTITTDTKEEELALA